MTITTVPHEIRTTDGPYIIQAERLASGLHVYEIPAGIEPADPCRWRIGHHSGRYIASTRDRAAALELAVDIADWADWTLDAETLRALRAGRDEASIAYFLECIRMAGGHLGACSDYGPYGC
ncbi:hypothetical protein ACFVXG_20415 [Kitasatospora sp. NPDC058162]|uniref:hypothetical protein n=1 Tax=Kitasatospora sp. NPDC058162 TaxID=3346362 RepID=UPI0036D7DD77